jgi:lysine-N-methylase
MHKKEPVHFLEREKKGEEEYEDYDPFLYSKLVDAREVMLQILQDRTLPIEQRKVLIVGISHDLQKRIDQGQLFSCDEVLERYQTEKAREYVKKWCEEEKPERYPYVAAWYRKLYQLELLREEWEGLVCESEVLLYQKGAKEYERMRQEYENWLQQEFPEWEVQCEQLLVYFLMTYFCGAVYDGNAYAKTWMTLSCVSLIEELLMARWIKNEHMLCMEDVIEIVYRFSREIEHSDPNLEKMEETR